MVALSLTGPVCGGQVDASFKRLPGSQVGEARWTPTAAGARNCRILIDPRKARTRVKRCQVLVHELYHLKGREHSSNPRSVMFWKAHRGNVPKECR